MNDIKRFVAIFLFFTLTCSLFFSCSQNSVKTDDINSQETSQTTETVTTDPYAISDNLPTDLNFDGATIRVLGRQVDDVFILPIGNSQMNKMAMFLTMHYSCASCQ